MDVHQFISLHPRLYHMAADGSWPSIRDNGLLTTAQQVERCAPPKEVADSILRSRRSQIIWLTTPDGVRVAVRDQKPLLLHNLVLEGTDLQGWLDILNSRVFFWVNKERLDKLLRARAYRSSPHHVIVVDTASLVSKHADQIRLSPFNTGATIFPPPSAPLRGPGTFQTLRDYRWASRVRLDGSRPIVEAAVIGGVPDIAEHIVKVFRAHGAERQQLA
jgi:hypothetical protein